MTFGDETQGCYRGNRNWICAYSSGWAVAELLLHTDKTYTETLEKSSQPQLLPQFHMLTTADVLPRVTWGNGSHPLI